MRLPRLPARLGPTHGALLIGAVVGLSVWQAALTRQSIQAHWVVLALAVAAAGATVVLGVHRQQYSTRRWAGRTWGFLKRWRSQPSGDVVSVIVWTVLIVGTVSWDLTSFLCQSHALPTLSYFIGHLTRYRVGRGLLFALWLGMGAYLVAGRQVRTPR